MHEPCGGFSEDIPACMDPAGGSPTELSRALLPETPAAGAECWARPGGNWPWGCLPHAASVRPRRYFLQPRDNGSKNLKPGDLGSLRLNVVYTEDHVFSSDSYSPLRDLLLKSADVEVLRQAPPPRAVRLRSLGARPTPALPHILLPGPHLPGPCLPSTPCLAPTCPIPAVAQHLGCLLCAGSSPTAWSPGLGHAQDGAPLPLLGTVGRSGCPRSLLSSVACLSVCGACPGRGLQREAGGGHPTGAALPALWPRGALHQRYCQRRGAADTVSAPGAGQGWRKAPSAVVGRHRNPRRFRFSFRDTSAVF